MLALLPFRLNRNPALIQGNYVVVSPGTSARRRIKAWGETKFADLVIRLKERYDLNPVLVGGKEDQEEVDQIIQSIKERDPEQKSTLSLIWRGR